MPTKKFCNMYADDTVIICTEDSAQKAVEASSKKLEEVAVWCEKNKISLNMRKTKHMFSGPERKIRCKRKV